MRDLSAIIVDSVISNSSVDESTRQRRSSSPTCVGKSRSNRLRVEMFTDTDSSMPSSRQRRTWRRASSTT